MSMHNIKTPHSRREDTQKSFFSGRGTGKLFFVFFCPFLPLMQIKFFFLLIKVVRPLKFFCLCVRHTEDLEDQNLGPDLSLGFKLSLSLDLSLSIDLSLARLKPN